jgi:hypothetical protein
LLKTNLLVLQSQHFTRYRLLLEIDLGETRPDRSSVSAQVENGVVPAPIASKNRADGNNATTTQHTPKVLATAGGRKGKRAVGGPSSSTIPATSLPSLEQYNEQRLAEPANHTTENTRDQSSLYRVLESDASGSLAKRAYPTGNDRGEDALHKRRRRRESSSSLKSAGSSSHADDKHEDSSNGTLDQSPKQISPHVRRDEESIHERERERNNQARINRARNNDLLGSHRDMVAIQNTTKVRSSARVMRLQDQQHDNVHDEPYIKSEPVEDTVEPVEHREPPDEYDRPFPSYPTDARRTSNSPWPGELKPVRGANTHEPPRAPRVENVFHSGQRLNDAFHPGPRLENASQPGNEDR